MTAVLIDVAEKVKDALNAATLSRSFTAERSYAEWGDALEDYDTLHVDVVPLQPGPVTELSDRGTVEYDLAIDVGVRYRFGVSDQESSTGRVDTDAVDGLVQLVQEIAEYFLIDRLTDTNTAVWESTEIKLSWSRKHLREMRQFFGFVRLTFKASKAFT